MKRTLRKRGRPKRELNRTVVSFHLQEAAEQLDQILKCLEHEGDYDSTDLSIDMGHLYHHLNTGWNGRYQTRRQFSRCSDEDFEKFRRFPSSAEFPYLAGEDEP